MPAKLSAKQGFGQHHQGGKGKSAVKRLTLLVCRLHMELPGDRVHSLPQMSTPVPAYCSMRSRSLLSASTKVEKGCLCTTLSSRLSVCPSGCTCSEQKYSEHAGQGLSLGALFSSSHLSQVMEELSGYPLLPHRRNICTCFETEAESQAAQALAAHVGQKK